MKLTDIDFADETLKSIVLATGFEEAEDVIEIRARKSAITSAQGIEFLPNLKLLDLTRNRLESVDVSKNTLLQELYLGSNELEELDLSQNSQLTHLEVFINEIAELDLSGTPKLENLYANKNDLTKLDLSNNPMIEEIQVSDNDLEELTLPKDCKPYIIKAENTKLDDDTKELLRHIVSSGKVKI